MPNLGALTEAKVRQRASAESFSRGEEYFQRGAVVGLARRGDQFSAEVEGSEYLPYRVTVTFDAFGVRDATCTCPYDWGGDCKHIVAALLASLRTPEAVEDRAPLADLLASLDRDQLVSVLLRLAETRPDLVDAIEAFAAVPAGGVAGGQPGTRARTTPLDGQTYRRQVSAAVHSLRRMRSSDAYWQVGGVVSEVRAIAEQARPFLDVGDGRSALVILEAVTDEYVETWTELDDSDGDASEWIHEIDGLWAEALLSADLTPAEREAWAQRFAGWARDLSDYGVEDVFLTAEAAAVQGWDDPRLVRILAGEPVDDEPVDDEPVDDEPPRLVRVLHDEDLEYDDEEHDEYEDDYDEYDEDDDDDRVGDGRFFAGDLAPVRLRILERQGRMEEYLRLARAEGQTAAYVTMLVRLGRTDEAVTQGMERLRTPAEALALARALHEHDRVGDALRIAEHGLTLTEMRSGTYPAIGWQADPDTWTAVEPRSHQRIELARWLRDAACTAGDADRALAAARVAVQTSGDLVDYREAATLAGDRWPEVKAQILDALRQGSPASRIHTVDVLLHEGLIDDAIAIADAVPYLHHVVEQVAAAAIAQRPEWVIKAARGQAESIMDGGKAQHYDTAARWLAKVRDASVAAGRDEEWVDYIESLLDKHRRKYKLMPLLQALR
jgi:uncharacterized Zn finger protein